MKRLLVVLALAAPTAIAHAQIDAAVINGIRWREIGPANMSGRIVDIEGLPSPSRTFYVVTAAGGVWKTTNNGVTFRPVLDTARVAAGGDMAIAPSDSNVLYVGTGEPNSRNSISAGGGIYKSTDGGKSWRHVGLTETRHIARIQVHPRNPNTAWVAALGAAWGASEDRGVYKTIDGGATWRKVKYVSDKAGFIDLQLDPRNPNVVWASSYERVRGPYFLKGGGPGSALWKSTDGGETWTEVKGGGLPETEKGRIEIAISPSSPNIMYLQLEAAPQGQTVASIMAGPGGRGGRGGGGPVRPSGLYRSEDGGKTWKWMNAENTRPFYYSQVRVHPTKPNRVWWSSTPVKYSNDGGATAGNATVGLHVDHHAMWIDPRDGERMVVGNDGGVGITYDGGGSYIFANTFAIGQFYNISHDMAVPYRVCGGLQDNGSWCGPSRRRQGAITNSMWHNVGGGDGFVTQQDWSDPNIIYSESQGGNMGRLDVARNQRTAMQKPQRFDSAGGNLRWNWNTPYIISRHNPQVLYFGANHVLKSVKRGDGMFFISPDLSARDTMGIRVSTTVTGGITPDVTGAETFSTIVSLNESPIRPGLLYAGTDDGKVWLTRNDGGNWEDLTGRFPGVPAGTYVSRIEPSHFDSSTFYVTFDNHRRQDFKPYVYTTTDFGRTFRSIANNLPTGQPDYVHVIREDTKNRDLLFVGTDVGLYVSNNRGGQWQRFMTGLPTTPVHDLLIHPRDNELIAATHGRSIWIADITPLQQLTSQVASRSAYLFAPRTAYQWAESGIGGGSSGHMVFQAPSPTYGADIWYRLTAANRAGNVRVIVQNAMGDTVSSMNGPGTPGLHRVTWNYQVSAPPAALTAQQRQDSLSRVVGAVRVLDSLQRANAFAAPVLAAARRVVTGEATEALQQAFGGRGGGGGGGGRAGGGGFEERPGESGATASVLPTGRAGAGAGGGGGGGGRGGGANPQVEGAIAQALSVDAAAFSGALAALRTSLGAGFDPFGGAGGGGGGGGGRGGRGGGGGGGTAGTGDYRVTIIVNGEELRQRLRVIDVGVGGQASIFP